MACRAEAPPGVARATVGGRWQGEFCDRTGATVRNGLLDEQHNVLMRPLNGSRVAKRSQGGKQLSYLESWDVRAHLIRLFGFANFDVQMLDQHLVGVREYQSGEKDMVEPIWFAKIQLTIRDPEGRALAVYSDAAVGSNAGPATMIAESHDNAIKTAASDALKRCAINLGSQFGLSLYDDGTTREVVKQTIIKPESSVTEPPDELTPEQKANLEQSLGATEIQEQPDEQRSGVT
jgi:recombination DNA repair RAD52 pathway protein